MDQDFFLVDTVRVQYQSTFTQIYASAHPDLCKGSPSCRVQANFWKGGGGGGGLVTQWATEIFIITGIKKQREIIALDRQGTQQRPDSPRGTPPGMQVNTGYMKSTKGTSSKKDAPW